MARTLAIAYQAAHWMHPLLAAINAQPKLATAHREWAVPTTQLSDLAFWIETRLENLPELIRFVDENLGELAREFDRNREVVGRHVAGGAAYDVEDQRALRRALLSLNAFATESRGCFEAMASFYVRFLKHYFGEETTFPDACSKIESLGADPSWATDLRALRIRVAHVESPWIEFEETARVPRLEPILIFDWRPSAKGGQGESEAWDSAHDQGQLRLGAYRPSERARLTSGRDAVITAIYTCKSTEQNIANEESR